MSRELAYLLLICGLLVVPGLLLRLRIPPPLTCFMLGVAVILALPGGHHSDAAVHLLAALGISTLFLYAGLEVNLETLRQAVGPLSIYLLTRVLSVAATAWLAWRYIDLGWQDATLLALALLTSSTGFIIDSLDRFGLADRGAILGHEQCDQRRIAGARHHVRGAEGQRSGRARQGHAGAVGNAGGAAAGAGRAGTLDRSLCRGFGIFAADHGRIRGGLRHRRHRSANTCWAHSLPDSWRGCCEPRVPQLASADNLHAVKLFSSFFLPFYFFARGAGVPADALSVQALYIGLALTIVLVPLRGFALWIKQRWLGVRDTRSSLRVAAALTPTLIFTLVLATILRERGAISDEWFGGLLLYAGLNTLLPSFVLRASFDVAPSPLEAARQIGARDAEHRDA